MQLRPEKEVRASLSTASASQELAAAASGPTIHFETKHAKTILYGVPGDSACEVLAECTDTHEHLYHLIRFLLTKPQHTHAELAQMFTELLNTVHDTARRLQPNSADIPGLFASLQTFLSASENAKLRQHVTVELVETKNGIYQAEVECSLPLLFPMSIRAEGSKIIVSLPERPPEEITEGTQVLLETLTEYARQAAGKWIPETALAEKIAQKLGRAYRKGQVLQLLRGVARNSMLVKAAIEHNFATKKGTEPLQLRLNPHFILADEAK